MFISLSKDTILALLNKTPNHDDVILKISIKCKSMTSFVPLAIFLLRRKSFIYSSIKRLSEPHCQFGHNNKQKISLHLFGTWTQPYSPQIITVLVPIIIWRDEIKQTVSLWGINLKRGHDVKIQIVDCNFIPHY